ncbi:PAS domain-containing sensor histidine kinase [Clostridium sardiniense]|uniref:sensor histidine kinase n=1 Tax=Clostridium sardiniense TaxID=29369 RepID=UPI00195E29E6|nr:PAS domain-containing sensor histidine kinase [Clostridium sardiniense]MBM7835027.1 signal transduction histidine kinase [Clostridium sardiniense]
MELEKELRDIIYINKRFFISIVVISFVIYIWLYVFLMIFIDDNVPVFDFIIKAYYVVVSCCGLLLTYSNANISESKIFEALSVYFVFFIIVMMNLLTIDIPHTFFRFRPGINGLSYKYTLFIVGALSTVSVYRYIANRRVNVIFSMFIIVSSGYLAYILESNRLFWVLLIVVILTCILVNIYNIYNISKYKLYINNKINYLYSYAILASIMNTLTVIMLFGENIFIRYIINLLIFISVSILFISTIYKIIDTPYKLLFKDLYESNEKLNSINYDISLKNDELEFSHNLIRRKEIMFKEFFRSIPVPIIILSDSTHRIIYCNKSFLNLIKEEDIKNVINKKVNNFISLDERERGNDEIAYNKNIYRGRIEKAGQTRYLNIEFIDKNKENGEIILGISDITSKVDMSSMKENLERKLTQEGIKRDFLSNISHDLKTPINVIYSALQLEYIFVENKDIQALLKYNNISKKNCLALIKLTNNLIDSSKIQSDYLFPTLEIINIVEFVEDTVNSLIFYANEKDIELIFDTDNEEIYSYLDEEFMQRILLNLISNSIKFTSKNGKIEVGIFENGDLVDLVIQDNGIGMDKEFIDKIFMKYAMGENNDDVSDKGSGIGLFVVKKLVELQKGNIVIESSKGQGTKITITFKREFISNENEMYEFEIM